MAEIGLNNLLLPGPSDGRCVGEDRTVWKFDGSSYNLTSKCFCVKKPKVAGKKF